MRYLAFALLFLVASCGKQVLDGPSLQYSYMPKYLDIDSIGAALPSNPEAIIDSSTEDFKSIPVYGGTVFNGYDSLYAPAGVLISEAKASKYVFYEAEYDRLKLELKYAKHLTQEYYQASLAAEKLYQDEIIRIQKEARRSWFEKNAPYLGFAAGILSAVLTELAVIKLAD
jgi:hypothetical protein